MTINGNDLKLFLFPSLVNFFSIYCLFHKMYIETCNSMSHKAIISQMVFSMYCSKTKINYNSRFIYSIKYIFNEIYNWITLVFLKIVMVHSMWVSKITLYTVCFYNHTQTIILHTCCEDPTKSLFLTQKWRPAGYSPTD